MIVPYTAAVSLKINFARLQGGFVRTPSNPRAPGYGPEFWTHEYSCVILQNVTKKWCDNTVSFEMALLYYVNAGMSISKPCICIFIAAEDG